MTRATRSQTVHTPSNKHESASSQHNTKKLKESKKRKRQSNSSDVDERPPAKLQKNGSDQDHPIDLTLDETNARGILEVLEEIDTQGLLDRVFPLNTRDSTSGVKADANTYSLRVLLQNPTCHDVRQLRTAVEPLYPISLHPRARLSDTAKQQRDFCDLALQLLDEATRLATQRISFDKVSLLPDSENEDADADVPPLTRRYALMQKLPTGEFWTSIDTPPKQDETGIKEADIGLAQRVAILPSMPPPFHSPPTLGSYETFKRSTQKFKSTQLQPRNMSRGSFLDYGPFASFAPSWDSEGGEIGRNVVGLVTEAYDKKKRLARARRQILALATSAAPTPAAETSEGTLFNPESIESEPLDAEMIDLDIAAPSKFLESPLSSLSGTPSGSVIGANDDIVGAKGGEPEHLKDENKPTGVEPAIEMIEVEQRVADLLASNAVAIKRLQYLQAKRLVDKDAPRPTDLEQKTAYALYDSLSTILALQPRIAGDKGEENSVVTPSLSSLRAVHQTLPVDRQDGWMGTLTEGKTTALRDDATIAAKANVPVAAATKPTTATNPSTPQPTTPYRSPFSYYPMQAANGQAAYYPSYPTTYTPPAPGQTPYPYPAAWGYSYPVTPASMKGAPTPPNFPSYFPIQSPVPQRAVGNTLKPQQPNGWSPSASALPPHLRRQPAQSPLAKTPSHQTTAQ